MEYVDVSPSEFATLDLLDDWRYMLGTIRADFDAGGFPAAAELVTKVAAAAEAAAHHPDLDVRYPGRVRVVLTTHATGGLTTADVDLAREVSSLASEVGATAAVDGTQAVEFAIDTMDADRIRPFWAAVLGYEDNGGYLIDPHRSGPPLWFQTMDEPRRERSRFHVDVSVSHDSAPRRIDAALAAGGTMVNDQHARSWWVLADADGNEACICTWQDR